MTTRDVPHAGVRIHILEKVFGGQFDPPNDRHGPVDTELVLKAFRKAAGLHFETALKRLPLLDFSR